MSKNIQLTITDPCHENWNTMTAAEKGRFCTSCQKQVIDFTNMSDSQLAVFFRKPSKGGTCGRFYPDQLDRNIEMPTKRIPWVRYFFQFTLPAFLISMKVTAQGNVKLVKPNTITKPRTVFIPARNYFLTENPTDRMSNNRVPQPLMAVNTPATELTFLVKPTTQLCRSESLTGRVGGVTVVRQPGKNRIPKQIFLFTQKLRDTAFKFFKVFPNPVSSGASLHIEWNQTEEGYFNLELINMSGKTVHSREIWIDADARLLNLEVPSIAAGNYFLRATNKQSGKAFSEKIVIQ